MDPSVVPPDTFEAMVLDALDALPDWVMPIVSEIAVSVEDQQDPAEVGTDQPEIVCDRADQHLRPPKR